MSEVKHTPGPWRYGAASLYDGFYIAPDARLPTLAAVHNFPGHAEANARLIAAAPELLSALKDAMRSSRKDFKHGPDGDRQHREAYAEQFAAIAKAEGRP